MKTILIGFEDNKGLGTPNFIFGVTETRSATAKVWEDAKRKHKFPKGVIRLELYRLESNSGVAIFVGDHVASEMDAYAQANINRDAKRKSDRAAADKFVKDLAAASKAVSITAVARSEKQSASIVANKRLESARQLMADAKKEFGKTKSDEELSKRATDAQAAFEAADKAWVTAKETLAALKNPSPVPAAS